MESHSIVNLMYFMAGEETMFALKGIEITYLELIMSSYSALLV